MKVMQWWRDLIGLGPKRPKTRVLSLPEGKSMNQKNELTFSYGDKDITIETGRMAKQADGSVMVTCGGTQVLVTVCSAKEVNEGQDFFPLLVDYKEKFYAAGKFLGGFNKREGRPSSAEILLMRMIDRPFRPMFPDGYFNETIIMAQVVSYSEDADPEILAGIGASSALVLSDIPFRAPVGFCKVAREGRNWILNPTAKQLENSDIELIVAGSEEAILMVEGEAKEVSEADMLAGIEFAHDNIKDYCQAISELAAKVAPPKRDFTPMVVNEKLFSEIESRIGSQVREVLNIVPKLERGNAFRELVQTAKKWLQESPADFGLTEKANFGNEAYNAVDKVMSKLMRGDILNEGKRIAGRGLSEIRAIETEIDILKTPHGSALFTRGETQVMGVVTIGGKTGEQMVDNLTGVNYDKFYLHYTFAPFCVGEARGYRGVGRREIGHGNLAERAVKAMIPEDYPYTLRVNCEVLESNGSSSMGSVCSASMALMDAGVPLKAPVAGIAMGLIKDGENFKILSDILGDEDHLGDMDFKVAGSAKGITAIQMDIKIAGINSEILRTALAQAKDGRIAILNKMAESISDARPEFKTGVPRLETLKIDPDKIGALIGPGGKNIKAIQEQNSVTIEVEETGLVKILGQSTEKLAEVKELVSLQINGPEIGRVYEGKVVTIKEYGAFVDIAPGLSGLVHVSEIAEDRVEDPESYLKEGQEVNVKVIEVDRFGKVKLSIKAAGVTLEQVRPPRAPEDRKDKDERSARSGGGRSNGRDRGGRSGGRDRGDRKGGRSGGRDRGPRKPRGEGRSGGDSEKREARPQ